MPATVPGTDLTHEAAVVRLFLSTYRFTALQHEVAPETLARVLDALERLETAAKEGRT